MDWTWDLTVLYQDCSDPKIEEDFNRLKALCEEARLRMEAPDPDEENMLTACVESSEEISRLFSNLTEFANLTLATDANNEPAQQLMDRLEVFSVQLSLLSSALTRYVGGVKDLDALIEKNETLKKVDFFLRRAREEARHLMDPAIEEWMLKMSLTGGNAFSNLRDKLDATVTVDYRGEKLPLAAVRAKAYDPDPQVRKDAYEAELASYAKIEIPMAACLNGIKGEGLTMIEAKGFDSILDETLFDSNMDRQTLDAMLTAIRESLPAFRRYLRKKAEILGHKDGLPFYDLFAPISAEGYVPRTYTIEEAREKLVAEMSKFTPAMGRFIDRAFENRWIDVFPREGKGGGAFCAGLHALDQSRVLTNFAGSFSDVSTLAHELGHAWHNRCMAGLPLVMRGAPMPLAETASIFNETLLANALRQGVPHDQLLGLLDSDLQNSTQVVVDIYSRFLFESAVIDGKKTHNLSVDEMKQLMLDAQDQSYGDGLDPEYRHPYMWACKSHYYIPGLGFYNFPYAFGLLFGKGVYAQYLEKGADFVPTYNQLLRSCGSDMVADVAASVGIDVRSTDFWRASLQTIAQDIDLFITLADEQLKK